jgi:hypothetical protein
MRRTFTNGKAVVAPACTSYITQHDPLIACVKILSGEVTTGDEIPFLGTVGAIRIQGKVVPSVGKGMTFVHLIFFS